MADLFRSPFLTPYAVPYGLPGGDYVPPVQGPWTPADLSGSLLWLDPRKHAEGLGMTSTDTLAVSSATDFSGAGNHAVQGTSTKRPILRFGETRWSYEFDGTDDFIEHVLAVEQVDAAFSVFLAWRSTQASQGAFRAAFSSYNSGIEGTFQYDYDGSLWRLNSAGSTAATAVTGPASSLTPSIVCIDCSGAAGPMRLRVNEVLYGDTGTDPLGGRLNRYRFGMNRTGNAWCAMRLFGAIVLDHQASDAERLQIEDYFNQQASMGLSL